MVPSGGSTTLVRASPEVGDPHLTRHGGSTEASIRPADRPVPVSVRSGDDTPLADGGEFSHPNVPEFSALHRPRERKVMRWPGWEEELLPLSSLRLQRLAQRRATAHSPTRRADMSSARSNGTVAPGRDGGGAAASAVVGLDATPASATNKAEPRLGQKPQDDHSTRVDGDRATVGTPEDCEGNDSGSDGSSDDGSLHQAVTEEECSALLYDPDLDDRDEKWVQARRGGQESDAVLSCPGCLTTVSIDCQQHDVYHNQYRTMFVMNCFVKTAAVQRRGELVQGGQRPEEGTTYHTVVCAACDTELGVKEVDSEVYHLHQVLATHA